MKIRIAGMEKESIVDGQGIRFVLFTQGCTHLCKGCHNPSTHKLDGGRLEEIEVILNEMDKNPLLDGITISGGEPFLQIEEITYLLEKVKERGLNTWVYTGFLYEEILCNKDPKIKKVLDLIDVLIDGPFIEEEKDLLLKFKGSKNQRIIDINKSLALDRLILLELD